jgi:hypothetical protein
MRYPQLLKIANKPAAQVTDEDLQTAVQVLRHDTRVAGIGIKETASGPMIDILSSEISGVYSVGRVIHALHETPEEISARKLKG